MRTAALRLCLIALLYLFLILPACLSLSLSPPSFSPCLAPSLSSSLPFLSLAFHHFIFCSSCSLFVCLRVSLLCLLWLICLSVFQSRHLFRCPTLPHIFRTLPSVFYLSLRTFCWCFSSSNIYAFRYLYSKRHCSVIAVWFIHSPTLHPPICLSLSVSLFFCGIEFSAAGAFKRTC